MLSLFKNNDIVILCERDHRELTQYNLILDIIGDQYFIDSVGVVFTEVAARNLNPDLNVFLQNDKISETEMNEQVLNFQRNCSFPLWEKSNFAYFIKGIHNINKDIIGKKIEMYPTDVLYVEGQPTVEKVKDMWFSKAYHRDSLMADYIIRKFEQLNQETTRRKALVIMNYRHAFGHFFNNNGQPADNVGRYLFEKYQDRIANVLINSYCMLEVRSDNDITFGVIQNGKWDAAFQKENIENIGFNFKDTPFGNDNFDYWVIKNNFTYKDVFTGFVFYQPLEKFEIAFGLPHLMENGFYEELVERISLFCKALNREMPVNKDEIMSLNTIHISKIENLDKLKTEIEKWLK